VSYLEWVFNFLKKTKKRNLLLGLKPLEAFTLIELLVIIGIISLLASLTLVVISEVRDRGKDTRIQTSLSQVRFEAALIYNSDGSYENLCCTPAVVGCNDFDTLNDTNDNLRLIEEDIKKYSGSYPTCYAAHESYCVESPLVTDSSKAYCIDSVGFADITDTDNCDSLNYDCSSP
jgi:type II secretory pathway pseudopilin PulG